MDKKYYWLKLKNNFFEKKEIKIMESMKNGKDYIIFLLKLKLRSVENEGYLRVSKEIPYNDELLATITNTNIDIVRSAMKVFLQFELIELLDDKTIYMNCIENLIGSETSTAERMRKHRQKKLLQECNKVTPKLQKSYRELDKDIEKEKEINITMTEMDIFNHWNQKNIIIHKKLNCKTFTKIHTALKDYSIDDIKKAINNYKIVLQYDKYFFNYKWSLKNFLQRGIDQFLDEAKPLENFLNNKIGRPKPKSITDKPVEPVFSEDQKKKESPEELKKINKMIKENLA